MGEPTININSSTILPTLDTSIMDNGDAVPFSLKLAMNDISEVPKSPQAVVKIKKSILDEGQISNINMDANDKQ